MQCIYYPWNSQLSRTLTIPLKKWVILPINTGNFPQKSMEYLKKVKSDTKSIKEFEE